MMCGICGFYDLEGEAVEYGDAVLSRMLHAISHRGPDGTQMKVYGSVAFGFNRLGFLDLEDGMQPLQNEDGSVTMICNGEIFNYEELRRELCILGHTFTTRTDVEVMIHLYEEKGLTFVNRLNGQFAAALYDARKGAFLLLRDHMGIAPLFYTVVRGRYLVFASEIKAILEYPGVPRRINLTAVDQLMNFPGTVAPTTFFRHINAMRPGHMLYAKGGGRCYEAEFWDLCYRDEQEDKGEAYYIDGLRALLKKSIERRLIAEVPVGFYVSGGLDSAAVACMIGTYAMDSAYSFSAEMEEASLDETRFQKMVLQSAHSMHRSVRITDDIIASTLSRVIYHAESAVKESYDAAAYLLSDLVHRSSVKAVLTGQGSDEFFCGYVGYMTDLFRSMQKAGMGREECEINERLWGDPYFRFERNHAVLRKDQEKLYSAALRGAVSEFSALRESPISIEKVRGLSSQKRRSYIDCKLRLSDHLLGEHGDRMFFSHSVEGRHPFLDRELLAFVMDIPDHYKLRGTKEKYILKRAMEGIVPDAVLRRKKFPFQAPGMSSLICRPALRNYLTEERIKQQGIFDCTAVERMKKRYAQPDFRLMGAYEIDYLLIVLTVTMLCEQYGLTV